MRTMGHVCLAHIRVSRGWNKDLVPAPSTEVLSYDILHQLLPFRDCAKRLEMCFRKKYIHKACGHARWGPVVAKCPSKGEREHCPIKLQHPYHTLQFESLCLECTSGREQRLQKLGLRVDRPSLGGSSPSVPGSSQKPKPLTEARLVLKEQKVIGDERGVGR